MSQRFEPIQTAKLLWKENLPYSVEYDDIYHSSTSGIEQSRHVFINGNGLASRFSQLPNDVSSLFTIGETGFGCGLNFLTTWALWREKSPPKARLHFISCEKHPLGLKDLTQALSFWPELSEFASELVNNYPVLTPGFHKLSFFQDRVCLTLMLGDAADCYEQLLVCKDPVLERKLRTSFIDAWFLDGFSPAKNECMWSDSLFRSIAMLSKQGTTLATYTASGKVKSGLSDVGFLVEKKKGFGPKRHMISAYFTEATKGLKQRQTPWHVALPIQYNAQEAIVIGAGLSGCFVARSLALRGWKVTLIEERSEIAEGASGNTQAVLFPLLSAYRSPLSQLMLQSFLYAIKVYQKLLQQHPIGELKGALILAHNEKESKVQQQLASWLSAYPELGILVDAHQSSNLSGLSVKDTGLFVPMSGWMDSKALCQVLIAHESINLITNQKVQELHYEDNAWQVLGIKAPVVVLTNGHQLKQFQQTQELPLKSIRGQMTSIKATSESARLKIPLCGEGHVLPLRNGSHSVGATYDLGNTSSCITEKDNSINRAKLNQLTREADWSGEILGAWAGVRASTPDYLPLVGPIARSEAFKTLYSKLRLDANRWVSQAGPYYPGLFACAGFGSRGLTTVPLCADWLAACINKEVESLPQSLVQAISPARFLRRDIVRGSK